jgi:hypothetical protein
MRLSHEHGWERTDHNYSAADLDFLRSHSSAGRGARLACTPAGLAETSSPSVPEAIPNPGLIAGTGLAPAGTAPRPWMREPG